VQVCFPAATCLCAWQRRSNGQSHLALSGLWSSAAPVLGVLWRLATLAHSTRRSTAFNRSGALQGSLLLSASTALGHCAALSLDAVVLRHPNCYFARLHCNSVTIAIWRSVAPALGSIGTRSSQYLAAPSLGISNARLLHYSAAPVPGHCSARPVSPVLGCAGALPCRCSTLGFLWV
jgi:hypothetical protein